MLSPPPVPAAGKIHNSNDGRSDKQEQQQSSHVLHVPSQVPHLPISSSSSHFQFDKLQPADEECDSRHTRLSGHFIARQALLDEEHWTAACKGRKSLGRSIGYIDNYKRKFAEQEFNALKRRCSKQHAEKCSCIIAVKKEEGNIRHTILKSIVGTLDISIRHMLSGETFPGEHVKAPIFSNMCRTDQPRYGYVANLCVAKHARRQGIATNMMLLALDSAKSYGKCFILENGIKARIYAYGSICVDQIFVHVQKDNMVAWKLYDKIGFQMVEMATSDSLENEKYLLCLKSLLLSSNSNFTHFHRVYTQNSSEYHHLVVEQKVGCG